VQINGKPTDALLVHTDIGSDITLECLVRGNPPPDLKWVRDAQVLTNSTRSYGKPYYLHIGEETWDFDDPADAEYRGRWVNLTILKTDPEDAGEYTCVGSNAGGVVEKNLTLNFQDVPSGAGVGHGVGGFGGGHQDQGWIWIVIGAITILALLTVVVSLVCLCSRRRRVKTTRAQDLKVKIIKYFLHISSLLPFLSLKIFTKLVFLLLQSKTDSLPLFFFLYFALLFRMFFLANG
jgi:hypothetical protein